MFELSDARRDELIERWAQAAVRRGLGAAAIFMLEAHKPVAGIGAQAVLAFQPMLAAFLSWNLDEVAAFLYHSDNVERLIRRIEVLEEERSHGPSV
jgi:hypothetical protein